MHVIYDNLLHNHLLSNKEHIPAAGTSCPIDKCIGVLRVSCLRYSLAINSVFLTLKISNINF